MWMCVLKSCVLGEVLKSPLLTLFFFFFLFCTRHYLFYLIHCQLMAEEAPDDINAYERFVLTQFLAGDISWMPLGKAISMGSAVQPDPEEETNHVGHNVALMNKTVESMKNDLIDLKDRLDGQMDDVKSQIALLLGKMK